MSKRRLWVPSIVLLTVGCSAPASNAPPQPATSSPSPAASATVPSASPSAPAVAAGATLTGRVYDEDLGAVAGATVKAVSSGDTQTAVAGADGAFSLQLAPGTYQVTASKAGWTSRTQSVNLTADTTVQFGGIEGQESNPYFLSSVPEIENVEVKEEHAGGPLKLVIHLSEPVDAASQQSLVSRLEVASKGSTPFLTASGGSDDLLKTVTTWDAAGQVLTLSYAGPYLASGAQPAVYTVRLRQETLDKKDPVTNEQLWDDIGVKDAEKHQLGYNRADFAFLKSPLFPITFQQLANKDYGYTTAERRWNYTHQSASTFVAMKDEQGPGLETARVNTKMQIGNATWDVLELHFDEPLWAVKDRDNLQFTQLDKDKQLVLLSVSTSADGANPQPFDTTFKVQSVRFSRLDPKVVYLHFSPDAFKDKKWVDVTLGADFMDPAGNKANTAKSHVTGPVS